MVESMFASVFQKLDLRVLQIITYFAFQSTFSMDTDYLKDLSTIRNIMEKRTKFISLSGLSGVLSGMYALIGAYLAYRVLNASDERAYRSVQEFQLTPMIWKLLMIALVVLVASLTSGFLLSYRNAKTKGHQFWNPSAKSLMFSLAIPLMTGGIFVLIALYNQQVYLIAPACLIFYGLALFSGGNFTFSDVKSLGIVEIILGLVCLCYPGKGLIFWAIGFGVLHIVYGSIMYFKYER